MRVEVRKGADDKPHVAVVEEVQTMYGAGLKVLEELTPFEAERMIRELRDAVNEVRRLQRQVVKFGNY